MLRVIRECDIFRKLPQEHREAAAQAPDGPVSVALRILSIAAVVALSLSELVSFMSPSPKQRFDLDMGETAALEGKPRKVRVFLSVVVHDFPCIDLSLDYQDVMGTREADVRSTVFKERLHKNGSVVGEVDFNDPKSSHSVGPSNPHVGNFTGNASCGSCYGARPPGECCNTCSDVLYAYRLKRWSQPRIESIVQCNDGSSETAYQPPQIIRYHDYRSDDYLPKWSQLGGSVADSGSEARISTPFKFNFTLQPLKPLKPLNFTTLFGDTQNKFASSFGFQPLSLNLSSFEPSLPSFRWNTKTSEETDHPQAWPGCIWRNLIIHGVGEGEALMIDLRPYGAKAGCWNDDCGETDKFNCDTLERCSAVCSQVPSCFWWTWGAEHGVHKCWLREARNGREKRFGFASGHRLCASPDLVRNASDTTHNEQTLETLHEAEGHDGAKASAAPLDGATPGVGGGDVVAPATTAATSVETGGEAELQPRRLSSDFMDDIFSFSDGLPSLSGRLGSLHMPIFSHSRDNDKEALARKAQQGESCRIHGFFDVNKVPGNFHIGTHGHAVPSYYSYSYYEEPAPSQNMQHTIERLEFGEPNQTGMAGKQPLDGFESPKAFTFQYYITLSPATRVFKNGSRTDGYLFRAGSFVTNELIGPAVFFRLDIDPIRVTDYNEEKRFSRFLVNICAVCGGCIAVFSVLSQFLDNAVAVTCGEED